MSALFASTKRSWRIRKLVNEPITVHSNTYFNS